MCSYKLSPDGGIGRRNGLKIRRTLVHEGSTPSLGIKSNTEVLDFFVFALDYIC